MLLHKYGSLAKQPCSLKGPNQFLTYSWVSGFCSLPVHGIIQTSQLHPCFCTGGTSPSWFYKTHLPDHSIWLFTLFLSATPVGALNRMWGSSSPRLYLWLIIATTWVKRNKNSWVKEARHRSVNTMISFIWVSGTWSWLCWWLYSVKIHVTVYSKLVQFILYKLCLGKVDLKNKIHKT